MSRQSREQRDLPFYLMLSQTGLEMVAPILLGVVADRYLGTMPWLTVVGAVLGPIGAIAHMVLLVQRHEQNRPDD